MMKSHQVVCEERPIGKRAGGIFKAKRMNTLGLMWLGWERDEISMLRPLSARQRKCSKDVWAEEEP